VRLLLRLCTLAVGLAAILPAASMVATSPVDFTVPPGATILWTMDVTNDANYMVPSSLNYVTASGVGTFTDLFAIAFLVLGPGDTAPAVGQYDVDAAATPGFVSTGQLVLSYDLFSVDPNDPLFDPGTDALSFGNLLALDASVTIQDAGEIPEPATLGLLGVGLAGLLLAYRRR